MCLHERNILTADDVSLIEQAISERQEIYEKRARLRAEVNRLTTQYIQLGNTSLAQKFDVPKSSIDSVQRGHNNCINKINRNARRSLGKTASA